MSSKGIMFYAFIWVMCTLICLFLEGGYWGSTDNNILNQLTGYNVVELGGLWGVVRGGIGFLTHGVPKLISFDYSFLYGGWMIIRIIFIAVFAVGFIWAMLQLFVPTMQRNL